MLLPKLKLKPKPNVERALITFEAIGTSWSIELLQEVSFDARLQLEKKIHDRIEMFDQAYSRFRSDSLVTQMAREAGEYQLPVDGEMLIKLYQDLYRLTDGAFTPLIGQVLVDAGYDAEYSLKPTGKIASPPAWDHVIDWRGSTLVLKAPALLDFGAAGKGYLVDLIAQLIEAEGVCAFTINAGGDIVCRGAEPVRVALEDPNDTTQAIGVAAISNQSICGSAGNRRAWGPYHHTIHPQTLTSPRHILATWVIAESGLLADALATCLLFVTPEVLQKVYTFDYVILYADGRAERSLTAPVELFLA